MEEIKENESFIDKEKVNEEKDEIFHNNNVEAIILTLIDKIIANAIHEIKNKEIYNRINEYCYNFTKNQIDFLLKTKYFFHDNEEEINKGKIFYNYKQEKFDNWTMIEEPKIPDKDRNNSNMIKIINCKKNDNEKEKLNSLNELIELESINLAKKNSSPKKLLKLKKIINKIKMINNLINNNNNNKKKRQKYNNNIIELNYVDLEKEKYFNIYGEINKEEEYNILRKQMEEDKIKNEKERKKNEEKRLFIEKTLKKLEANKNRRLPNVDGKKITFDSNGKVLSKHIISINKLKKDFIPIKSTLIEENTQNKKRYQNLKYKLDNSNDKKEINIKKEENILNNQRKSIGARDNNIVLNNTDKNIMNKKENNEIKNNDEKKEEIIYKKLNINQFKINRRGSLTERNIKNKKIKIEYNPKDKINPEEYDLRYKKTSEKKAITPSGSNLDVMIPVTGVVLKYNHFKRDGGFDYFKKYNRPSMKDFKKLALSYSPAEMQGILLFSNNTNNNSSNDFEKILYNGYKENFDDSNNPLIKNAHKISFQQKRKSITNSSSVKILKNPIKLNNKKNILLSDDLRIKNLNIDETNISNSNNFQNNIQLSNSIHFDNLYNFFSEEDNSNFPDYMSNSNIKKSKGKYNIYNNKILNEKIIDNNLNNYKLPIIKKKENELDKNISNNNGEKDQMAKFNFDIIKDIKKHDWGKNITNNNELSFNYIRRPILESPKKMTFKKIEKIRERKNVLDKIKNPEKIDYEKLLVSKKYI